LLVSRRAKILHLGTSKPAATTIFYFVVANLSLVALLQPASAQGLFETLFGGFRYHRAAPLPPQTSFYADPQGLPGRESRPHAGEYGGRGTLFCVRTCDGRYFPLLRHAGVLPAQMCRSFCPASKTMVFSGSKIDYAVAQNGLRYADLKSAFAYRERVVENCTCNGRDGLGLARLNATSDPTLRPGDIVATNEGFMSYRGKKSKAAQFTPIDPSSSAWARKLSKIKIEPAPAADALAVAPLSDEQASAVIRSELRRAQLDR